MLTDYYYTVTSSDRYFTIPKDACNELRVRKGFCWSSVRQYFMLNSSCYHFNDCTNRSCWWKNIQWIYCFYIFHWIIRTDTLGSDRVNAEWNIAHKCNFIHPKIYYYDQPLKGNLGYILILKTIYIITYITLFNVWDFIWLEYRIESWSNFTRT